MLSDILNLFGSGGMSAYGFMPHGFCFMWRPDVLWLHVLSDGTIAAAYYCIPLVLVFFIRRRPDLPFPAIFWMFSAFILTAVYVVRANGEFDRLTREIVAGPR